MENHEQNLNLCRRGPGGGNVLRRPRTSRGQWLNQPTKGIPRTADGKPDLQAPLPRTADGKPDLSGVWQPAPDPNDPAGGIEGAVGARYLIGILRDVRR